MQLVTGVYSFTQGLPADEKFGLISQLRRAAISIPANIAEGMGRQYKKDSLQFLFVARGSLYELETLLTITAEVGLTNADTVNSLLQQTEQNLKILNGLISYLEKADLK